MPSASAATRRVSWYCLTNPPGGTGAGAPAVTTGAGGGERGGERCAGFIVGDDAEEGRFGGGKGKPAARVGDRDALGFGGDEAGVVVLLDEPTEEDGGEGADDDDGVGEGDARADAFGFEGLPDF